jgi:hypothetical protein
MRILKRLSLTLAAAACVTGSVLAQTPLVFTDAELAVPFGAAKGQLAFVADNILFVAADSPRSSLAINRADIAKIERSGDVVTVVTRRPLRDSDGERDTFRFRLSQPADMMRWYETTASSAAAIVSSPAPAGASRIIASYPARHGHFVGSCQGTLILSEDAVAFEALDHIDDSRKWKLVDIKKVEQSGVYKLKVEPFQGGTFDLELQGKGIDSSEFRQLVDRIARARVVR